jgi:hypothetical protein
MNGENDHLFDESHLDLCPVCDKNPCDCKPELTVREIMQSWIDRAKK